MKIVRIIARLNIGGPAIHVSVVSAEMAKHGHDTLLVTGEIERDEGDMSYLAEQLKVPVCRIPTLGRRISFWRDIRALLAMYSLIRREKPDVVHTHTAKAGTLGRIAAWMVRVPCIVHTFHGNVLESYFSPIASALFRSIERFLARISDRVISITPQQKRELTEVHSIAPAHKVAVIRLGFDLDPWLRIAAARTYHRTKPCRGAWVGRFTEIKDPLFFVRGASMCDDTTFVMVGGGEMYGEVANAIEATSASNIHLAGWKQDMGSVYAAVDFVVLTSLNEGTPVALIEAMATGLPIIATPAGGVADLMLGDPVSKAGFEVYSNGIILTQRSEDAFVAAIHMLVDEPELRKQMGEVGQKFVVNTYGQERLVTELERLYEEVLQSKNRSRKVETTQFRNQQWT
jgi:glycosyltransferase involved in cell wall biosynthesis